MENGEEPLEPLDKVPSSLTTTYEPSPNLNKPSSVMTPPMESPDPPMVKSLPESETDWYWNWEPDLMVIKPKDSESAKANDANEAKVASDNKDDCILNCLCFDTEEKRKWEMTNGEKPSIYS